MDDKDPLDADSQDLGEAAAFLAYAAPERRPPAYIKDRLMASLRPAHAPFFSKRRVFPVVVATTSAVLLAVIWLRAPDHDARVVAVGGGVTVDGRAVAAGDPVSWGSVIEVPLDGEAVVRLGDRAVFKLSRGGRATLARSGDALSVRLSAGWLLSAVKTGTPYAVLTEHSRISALGTDFIVKVRGGRAYACICHGRIGLEGDFPVPEIASQGHRALSEPLYEPGMEGGLEGHDDEEIARLRAALK
jgi:hypothetical protein